MAFRKLSLSFLAALSFCGAFSPLAAAQSSPAVSYVGPEAGRNDATSTEAAGSWKFSVDGKVVVAFCVEMLKDLDPAAGYSVAPTSSSFIPNLPRASYIASSHASLGTPAADAATEAAATQVAIWSLTDNFTIDATSTPAAEVRERALQLVSLSVGHENPSAITDAKLTVAVASSSADVTKVDVAAKLLDGADNPQPAKTISFSNGSATTTGQTAADGTVVVQLPAPAAGAALTYTASWSGVSGPGALVKPDSTTAQILMLTESFTMERKAEANFTQPAQVTTTSTTTASTVTTATTAGPSTTSPIVTNVGSLPFTGGSDGPSSALVVLLGGTAAAAVAGSVLALRRRSNLR